MAEAPVASTSLPTPLPSVSFITGERGGEREGGSLLCVSVSERECVCVCVCVREREREREEEEEEEEEERGRKGPTSVSERLAGAVDSDMCTDSSSRV